MRFALSTRYFAVSKVSPEALAGICLIWHKACMPPVWRKSRLDWANSHIVKTVFRLTLCERKKIANEVINLFIEQSVIISLAFLFNHRIETSAMFYLNTMSTRVVQICTQTLHLSHLLVNYATQSVLIYNGCWRTKPMRPFIWYSIHIW